MFQENYPQEFLAWVDSEFCEKSVCYKWYNGNHCFLY